MTSIEKQLEEIVQNVAQTYLDENLMQVAQSKTQITSQRADNDDDDEEGNDEDENFKDTETT